SSTGRFCSERAALATCAASRAAAATAAFVIVLVAANPQLPFTSVRTPRPYDSVSLMLLTRRSRVAMFWRRYRPMRTSAYDAPARRAASSASSARSSTAFSAAGATRSVAPADPSARAAASDAAVAAVVLMKSRRVLIRDPKLHHRGHGG